MKKILYCCSILVCSSVLCCLLSSCYAFLQADKLIYSGNVFKKPSDMHIDVVKDSVNVDLLK